ncbi:serine hydrolase domain-containing protein [Lacipirellula parvula]|uniref:Beta-lactamase n=1 Tax=Lacipirellula parvula TaxID=2650471 RepID=A0A5K7XK76_9BACT|nr:serine hydrolase domain-containing protein [Lacipirellula parvula]BBO36577.1 beta-lactamase [Lacipirellula parvula]
MNSPRSRYALLLVAIVASLAPSRATAQHVTDEWVEQMAAPLIEHHVVDGISIGYIEGDRYGIVHLGNATRSGKNADNLTLYELGSITKVFTSLLLADAVAQGKIDLNEPAVAENAAGIRLPSHDGAPIKWIDLSTHRAGLPKLPANLAPADPKNPYRDYTPAQAAEFVNGFTLPRAPGEAMEYSNFGASLLGYLLAQQAGKSYQELLNERIAGPLKMTDVAVELSDAQAKRLATPHDRVGSPTPAWTRTDFIGSGGIHANMRDMLRFAKAQLEPPAGPVGEAIELAWKQQRDADKSGPAIGLGWMIAGDGQTRWHNGGTGGTRTAIFINRELKAAAIVLCNTAVANEADQLATLIIQQAAGHDIQPPAADEDAAAAIDAADGKARAKKDDKTPAIDAKLRRRLVGRYQLRPDFIFDVNDEDGHLMVGITNQATQEVFPDSPTRWSYRGIDATLEFKLPKSGVARSLVLHQNGAKQVARRISK